MRRAVISMIALPGLAATVAATAFAAMQSETVSFAVLSGIGSVIGEHGRWNELCRALDAPVVTLERAALHGSVCVRHDLITPVQSRSGRAVNCIGHRLNGVIVVYRPRRGFAGTDTLRYSLEFPEGLVSREISIDIQARTDDAPEFFLNTPASRTGERVPECAGESS